MAFEEKEPEKKVEDPMMFFDSNFVKMELAGNISSLLMMAALMKCTEDFSLKLIRDILTIKYEILSTLGEDQSLRSMEEAATVGIMMTIRQAAKDGNLPNKMLDLLGVMAKLEKDQKPTPAHNNKPDPSDDILDNPPEFHNE